MGLTNTMEMNELLLTPFISPLREGASHTVIPTLLTGAKGRERPLWLFSAQLENEDKNIMAPASRMVLLTAASQQHS